jgi:superoxide dismutase
MKNFSIGILASFLSFFALSQNFTLPKLAYDYKALEGNIDAQTMEIHHFKHHQAYVTNLNKALIGSKFENKTMEDILLGISRASDAIRNNAGGHYNHTLFWEILTPQKDTKISETLLLEINKNFTSLDSLKKLMNQAATTRFGSGWAWLILTPDKKLQVCSTPNQDNPLMDINADRGIPILGIDVWEHAYYLKYQNKRGDYLAAIWNVINWEAVSKKYEEALNSSLLKYLEIDTWKAYNEFQKVLGQSYQPAENGDLSVIKARSSELMLDAVNLKASNIPKSLDSPEIKKNIDELVKLSNELHKMVKKKMKDPILKAKLFEVHEAFHRI